MRFNSIMNHRLLETSIWTSSFLPLSKNWALIAQRGNNLSLEHWLTGFSDTEVNRTEPLFFQHIWLDMRLLCSLSCLARLKKYKALGLLSQCHLDLVRFKKNSSTSHYCQWLTWSFSRVLCILTFSVAPVLSSNNLILDFYNIYWQLPTQ